MKEMKREPEVIFWVFGFPVLLALGLGIAFRNKPVNTTSIAIVSSAGAADTLSMIQRSSQNGSIHAVVLDREAALQGFRLGKYDLIVEPEGAAFRYHYDPSRQESVLSRAEVDSVLQKAAGRKDILATSSVSSSEPGSRYIDFLIPGLLGMNLMNAAMWGIGFALVDMRQRKLLKRFVATPAQRLSHGIDEQPNYPHANRSNSDAQFGRAGISHAHPGIAAHHCADRRHWRYRIRRCRAADRESGAEDRKRQRTD